MSPVAIAALGISAAAMIINVFILRDQQRVKKWLDTEEKRLGIR